MSPPDRLSLCLVVQRISESPSRQPTYRLIAYSYISYRGEQGKTTGYYVPKGAEEATREGVAAWRKLQECLRELAEINKERNLRRAREAKAR